MFDGLKNLAGLPAMLGKARELQEKLKQLQAELAERTFSADAGGGMVRANVSGRLEVISVKFDRSKLGMDGTGRASLSTSDIDLLEDLATAAIRAAQAKAAETLRLESAKLAQQAGLPPDLLEGRL